MMEKKIQLTQRVVLAIAVFLLLSVLMVSCPTSSRSKLTVVELDSIRTENKRLMDEMKLMREELTQYATEKETRAIIQEELFEFLIYEDDLDKKKTSLTDIRRDMKNRADRVANPGK